MYRVCLRNTSLEGLDLQVHHVLERLKVKWNALKCPIEQAYKFYGNSRIHSGLSIETSLDHSCARCMDS